MFLNDQETATDLLYYAPIAKTVKRLLDESRGTPVTIGVHGDWGAGKSSVLKMTQQLLNADERVCCIWFNGWTFEGFEDAKTVVIQTIVDELQRARPGSKKVADAAKKVLRRIDWFKLAKHAGGLGFTALSGLPSIDQLKGAVESISAFVHNPGDHLSIESITGLAERAGGFIKDAEKESEQLPEHMHKFRAEFEELLTAADIDQLVVIVDDLDRCLPKTAIATLEAIRLFLFVNRTAFVVGADEAMIEYAVREHFPDLPQGAGPVTYARNYLEKLIQVPFRIPALGLAETRSYITLLQLESVVKTDDDQLKKLLTAAQKDMLRPWKSSGLDRKALTAAFGDPLPDFVQEALDTSALLARILSEGTRGNPRQIKRFLNSMMLRHAIAEARGFAEDIRRPILAKIMLAERFHPDFYEQLARIASLDADGSVPAIAELEKRTKKSKGTASESEEGKGSGKLKAVASSGDVHDWEKSDWISNWAAIDPALTGVDLRPYIFVTRDKRSSLMGQVAVSHLEALVDKLMGPALQIRQAATKKDIVALAEVDAENVFDALRDRIIQADEYSNQPKGVPGLIELVKQRPALQKRLVEFVRSLPTPKLGMWAPAPWHESLKDTNAIQGLEGILRGWSQQVENETLQKASKRVLEFSGKS
ncbi:Qat anti-phage system ATPase QatA [Pseudomonas nunensis]|uniref:Qat anti-phage system ATPase QatA n=1 Tax=Pseudomonas nunensis TaxID=2961896 RepID=UPI0025AEF756|nr:Qat anti-phage system ATPase QatA [Pseudomonas nunensis]MDN3219701.1 P-loop NTPase fold protein [Pseudomonas nunensis]